MRLLSKRTMVNEVAKHMHNGKWVTNHKNNENDVAKHKNNENEAAKHKNDGKWGC